MRVPALLSGAKQSARRFFGGRIILREIVESQIIGTTLSASNYVDARL